MQAEAEHLPFPDDSFDAAMSVFSDHHWRDRTQGFSELRRVARRRVVLFNANPGEAELFWLTSDGFYGAFWRRPEAYLDRQVRSGISVFHGLSAGEVQSGIEALGKDLESGAWQSRHRGLLEQAVLHLGYYAAIAELD